MYSSDKSENIISRLIKNLTKTNSKIIQTAFIVWHTLAAFCIIHTYVKLMK